MFSPYTIVQLYPINENPKDPDAEDASNIMRVISIKVSLKKEKNLTFKTEFHQDYCDDTRVIIQLMLYHNKVIQAFMFFSISLEF